MAHLLGSVVVVVGELIQDPSLSTIFVMEVAAIVVGAFNVRKRCADSAESIVLTVITSVPVCVLGHCVRGIVIVPNVKVALGWWDWRG